MSHIAVMGNDFNIRPRRQCVDAEESPTVEVGFLS